jgi:hypothetical protein
LTKLVERGWTAAVWRSFVANLDFATPHTYMANNIIGSLNPGPSGEDAEMSANLAMSDQPFRAKPQGSADVRAKRSTSSLICLI